MPMQSRRSANVRNAVIREKVARTDEMWYDSPGFDWRSLQIDLHGECDVQALHHAVSRHRKAGPRLRSTVASAP